MSRADRDNVVACWNGHPEAFRQLVVRYQAVLLSYLSGRFGNRDQAEEAAQETLVRAFFALRRLRKPDSFFSWLLGIANRVANEQVRTEQRHRDIARLMPQPTAGSEHSPDYALERAVAELPETYREVVLLRYYGRCSCAEVAEQLGIPLGTVTKQLSRAYAMLRQSLSENDDRPPRSEVRS